MKRRSLISKLDQGLSLGVAKLVGKARPRWGTLLSIAYYQRHGMVFDGLPNYISTRSWFDGTDYSLISIGEGTTISSNVSFLTHDWSLHTVGRAIGYQTNATLGLLRPIDIGAFCFIGRGAIIMPGTLLGRGCIVGAGAVVRGQFDDFSLIIGSPAEAVGRSDEYFHKKVSQTD